MMQRSANEMNYRVSAAHCVEASFSCPFFMENIGIIALGTILMVSIFISLALGITLLLALLIGLGLSTTAPEEHPDLV